MPSSSCALLLTRRVLCSVDDEHAALMEIYRVLKPGRPGVAAKNEGRWDINQEVFGLGYHGVIRYGS